MKQVAARPQIATFPKLNILLKPKNGNDHQYISIWRFEKPNLLAFDPFKSDQPWIFVYFSLWKWVFDAFMSNFQFSFLQLSFQFVDHFLLLFCVSRVTLAKQRTLTSSLRGCPWRRPPRTPPPSTSCPTSRAMSLKGSALPTQNSVLQSCCSLC